MAAGRNMKITLSPGPIGVKLNQSEAIAAAHRHGFEAVEPEPEYLGRLSESDMARLLDDMKSKNLVFGATGVRFAFHGQEGQFTEGMKALPAFAKTMQRVGAPRVIKYIAPGDDSITYLANFKTHVRRVRAAATVLGDHGLRLGLEYVGPKTSWTARRHSFIHTMAETKELIAETGARNLGFVLDSWHWYTAQETEADLLTLKNADIVSADLNDARLGVQIGVWQ